MCLLFYSFSGIPLRRDLDGGGGRHPGGGGRGGGIRRSRFFFDQLKMRGKK
jgi:hypothetical protein